MYVTDACDFFSQWYDCHTASSDLRADHPATIPETRYTCLPWRCRVSLLTLRRVPVVLIAFCSLLAAQAAPQYRVLKKFALGGEGGWDYITVDALARRVYIARATRVMVVDADSGASVGEIAPTPGVHGVALAPESGRGFISNGGESTVTIFDPKTLKTISQVKVGDRPDAIIYDPASKRVFTFNARGHDTTAIDAASGTVAGSLPLGGKPEFAAPDGQGHMFVNIEDTGEISMFDTHALKELKRWKIAPCEEPSGLALDRQHARIFSVCGNRLMAISDAAAGKLITTVPIGGGADGVVFDPDAQLAFSTNGQSGNITVVHEDAPDKFTVVQTLETARGARTVALDAKTHNVYTVTAQFGAAPAPTEAQPRPRPAVLPNTFTVIVVGK